MKKKILTIVLLLTFVVGTLCSCKSGDADLQSDFSSVSTILTENESSSTDSTTEKTSKTTTESTKGKTTADETTTNSSSSKKETETTSTTSETSTMPTVPIRVEVQVEETIITDEEIEEPITFEPIKEIELNNEHNSINKSDYYQYASLSEKEKRLYKSIVDTIEQSGSIVNTSRLSVSYEDIVSVFQKVLTDYPQYFYVSRSCMLAYSSRGNTIRAIVLLYTDGEATDEYDENMNLLQSADRTVINQKIDTLQSTVEKIVSKIPSETSEIIKEKYIHDYIVETVRYDYNAAENIDNYMSTIPHAFDLYGAAIEGLAVCEGYSKLFQYLCYSVGINSTQVIGTSNGGNHMWNAVLIDEEWYQIDVTWNDTETIIGYSYFNLNEEKISKDHTIDDSTISVPQCVSTENSFISVFAVCITDLTQAPTNYETAIANIKEAGDKMLYVYIEGYELDRMGMINTQRYTRYIQQYMLKTKSDFSAYLSAQGISLSNSINRSNEFIVLTLKY